MRIAISPAELDRVRRNTAPDILRRIDAEIARNVRFFSSRSDKEISARIAELEAEWSIERWLQANVSLIGFTTAVLAFTSTRKWGLVTCIALAFLLVHGTQGFDPYLLLLRRLGIRTRGEIDRELYALKILRGDFARIQPRNKDPEIRKLDARVKQVLAALRDDLGNGES